VVPLKDSEESEARVRLAEAAAAALEEELEAIRAHHAECLRGRGRGAPEAAREDGPSVLLAEVQGLRAALTTAQTSGRGETEKLRAEVMATKETLGACQER
jgi:hypothetical protein